jgi:hypothetical protein
MKYCKKCFGFVVNGVCQECGSTDFYEIPEVKPEVQPEAIKEDTDS